jgi:hypothetical protein
MGPEGRSLRSHPVHKAAESRARAKRLTGRPRRMDRGKVPRVERLRWQYRIPLHKGRTVDSHHDLPGNRIHRLVVPYLLRLRECECIDLDDGRRQQMDGVVQSAGRFRALPEGYQPATARMGGAVLRGDSVLIASTAASVNPIDWKMRSGARQKDFPLSFPAILAAT